MTGRADSLDLVLAEEVKAVEARQIDAVIEKIIQESAGNYEEIGNLALECSASLSSAQAKANAMASRGFFKRNWDKFTGKDAQLRSAIELDHTAAQYAMQQTINELYDYIEIGNYRGAMRTL